MLPHTFAQQHIIQLPKQVGPKRFSTSFLEVSDFVDAAKSSEPSRSHQEGSPRNRKLGFLSLTSMRMCLETGHSHGERVGHPPNIATDKAS